MALPSLVLVTLMLAWVIGLVTAQLECVDAARAGARVVSRGEDLAASEAAALAAAPDGAAVAITRSGDFVRVEVVVSVAPLGGLAEFLPRVTVNGVAHAIAEDAVGSARLDELQPMSSRSVSTAGGAALGHFGASRSAGSHATGAGSRGGYPLPRGSP